MLDAELTETVADNNLHKMILSIGLCLTPLEKQLQNTQSAHGRRERTAAEETGRGGWGRERSLRQWLLCHLPAWGWFPQDPSSSKLSLLSLSLLNYKEVKEA